MFTASLQFSGTPAPASGARSSSLDQAVPTYLGLLTPDFSYTGCWSPVHPAPRRGRIEFLGAMSKSRCTIYTPPAPQWGSRGIEPHFLLALLRFAFECGKENLELTTSLDINLQLGHIESRVTQLSPTRAEPPHPFPCTSGGTAQDVLAVGAGTRNRTENS